MPPFVPGIGPGTNRVCPRDKPGEIGLPLCQIRSKPGFVPGFHRICPRDKPGEIPGTNPGSSQDQPDKKAYVCVPFSCLSLKRFLGRGPGHPGKNPGTSQIPPFESEKVRAARVQNEIAPEKLLNRYEKRFEKREKRPPKKIRNAFEKCLAPLRPPKNISPALFN